MEEEQSSNKAAYNGECSFALSTGKKGVPGKESITVTKDGETYRFSSPIAKLLFNLLPERKEKADATFNQA